MITIEQLTKQYGKFTAVDRVSFVCHPGRVTGFLGPNGAGKTTTMRIMVGLTPATSGTVTIGGHRYADIPNPARYVGTLLDASAQHAGRTGLEVLTLTARTVGVPMSRVGELLETVSLSPTEAKRRIKDYSLGMRQRLGIANAMLGEPSVLVLDEPANGLDPAGIRWMRDLLRSYADRGGTVLLSSHLLHEVEQTADDLVLIGNGRILAQGDKQTLMRDATGEAVTFVAGLDNTALAGALQQAGLGCAPQEHGVRVHGSPVDVGRVAAHHGLVLTELRSAAAGLEQVFMQLTNEEQREPSTTQPGSPDGPHTTVPHTAPQLAEHHHVVTGAQQSAPHTDRTEQGVHS